MNLFEIIPQNYFGLFGGKNRYIYVESLLILYSLMENDETIISKNDYNSNAKAFLISSCDAVRSTPKT